MADEKTRLLAGVIDLLRLADELGELDAGICLDRARLHLEEHGEPSAAVVRSRFLFN